MIILDSDVLIEILDKRSRKGDEALTRVSASGERLATTAINLHEILYGITKRGKKAPAIQRLRILAYAKEDAELSARVELEAERKGTPTLRTDAMIAAIAINNNAALFTFDEKHYENLQSLGLKLIKF